MTFLYPLGLLGLIGIPILVFIYIIKSKYTEQTVSSTYLWSLSERFLKRKRRPSMLAGMISLILQLLCVTAISLLIAHPVITVPDSANEYVFVLDGSGSMHFESDGESRFERAKRRIGELIGESADGSVYSLISVGNTTNVVYERLDDKDRALLLLSDLSADYRTADYTDALGTAQGYFDENRGALTYLLTDTDYSGANGIRVENVAVGEKNTSLLDVVYHRSSGKLTVSGNVISHTEDRAVSVRMYLDGSDSESAVEVLSLSAGELTPFVLECSSGSFSSIRVALDGEDGLALDNEYLLYDVRSESSYNTLIVSERPFFIESALSEAISAKIDVLSPDEYSGQTGYGLYVFDSCTPESLPRDGAIWLVNPQGSTEGAGFSVQGEVSFSSSAVLEKSGSSSSATKALLSELRGDEIHVTKYVKCAYYRSFTTLYSYKGNPVIFAGSNSGGNRQVTLAFDLHNSNFPLLYDYMALISNLVDYSFPEMIDRTSYECGEEAEINVVANCDSIRVESPRGVISYLNTDSASATVALDEVGVYTVTVTVAGSPRQFNIYSSMTDAECIPAPTGEGVMLVGEPGGGGFDGKYDALTALFIALALLFTADWMVYCYDKYQLR
ncbi:MAG: BatA and WFA domain-containing protein [Clostridia bacterium]|nr:BatA and WFA domain-containing protein [Clostridia bacterium]